MIPAVAEPMAHDVFVEELRQGHLECLERPVVSQRAAEGVGPRRAIERLALTEKSPGERLAWVAEARFLLSLVSVATRHSAY